MQNVYSHNATQAGNATFCTFAFFMVVNICSLHQTLLIKFWYFFKPVIGTDCCPDMHTHTHTNPPGLCWPKPPLYPPVWIYVIIGVFLLCLMCVLKPHSLLHTCKSCSAGISAVNLTFGKSKLCTSCITALRYPINSWPAFHLLVCVCVMTVWLWCCCCSE